MSSALLGQILAVISAMCFAGSNVFISRGSKDNRNVESGVVFSIFVTLVLSGLIWLVLEGGQIPAVDSAAQQMGLIYFALAGFAAMVLGRSLIYRSIRTIGIIRASTVRRLNPFFSIFLAFIVLGETINPTGLTGMGLVAGATLALVLRPVLFARSEAIDNASPPPPAYIWGVCAAMAYSVSYLFRKFGLAEIGAPAFGTFVSAATGFASYFVFAIFTSKYRDAVKGMFSQVNANLIAAGVMVSMGQILLFAALYYERIAIVAIISSLELFFATTLAVALGAEKRPDRYMVVAGVVATIGVILIALASA